MKIEMKIKIKLRIAASVFICMAFLSCKTSGMYYKTSNAWSIQDTFDSNNKIKLPTKIKLGIVKADKTGGALTLEREISALLPLLFLEHNYIFTNNSIEAAYIVDVSATEREFFVGWNTKKSITMEVLFWSPEHISESDKKTGALETPLIAGRIVAQGTQGLASSNNLQDILRRSIAKTVQTEILVNAKNELTELKIANVIKE
jgi:hypothetical protein